MMRVAERMPTEMKVWGLASGLGVEDHVTVGKLSNADTRMAAAMKILLYWRDTVATAEEAYESLRGVLVDLKLNRVIHDVMDCD